VTLNAATGLLTERVALVTGGAQGLGAAIARAFACAGAVGSVVDLETGACEPGWTALAADVTDEDAVERAVAETVRRFERLDIVVANAGVVPAWSETTNFDLAALDRTLAVNVRGVAATLKHGARAMMKTGGAIVVTASMNSWHALPAQSAYTASKHAVLGLVRTAALDLGGHGIRVNAIGPGPVATDAMLARLAARERDGGLSVEQALRSAAAGTALGRMVTLEDVARAALFLASDLSSGITGAFVPVDAGLR
jgi:NAD(P)-dependent dehydrogenase (short-subunit alcohol dehydrogenase family)